MKTKKYQHLVYDELIKMPTITNNRLKYALSYGIKMIKK